MLEFAFDEIPKRRFHYRLTGANNAQSIAAISVEATSGPLMRMALEKGQREGIPNTDENNKKLMHEFLFSPDKHYGPDYVARICAAVGFTEGVIPADDNPWVRCGQCHWHWAEASPKQQITCPKCKSTQAILPYSEENLKRGVGEEKTNKPAKAGKAGCLVIFVIGTIIGGIAGAIFVGWGRMGWVLVSSVLR